MASIIGTPGFFDLGQTTTPGAQSLTVPSDATHVAIFFYLSDDASTPNATVSTLTSDFAGTFTINNSSSTTVAMGGSVCTAAVTSTGAGKTFTPTFASVNTVAEAGAWCVFLKEVSPTWPTGVATAHATGTGTTAGTATATGAAGGLAIAVDSRLNATSGTYPANETGWTSVATGQTGPGGLTYYANSRIRTLAISADGNVSATTQNPNGSVVSILTIESWRIGSGALAGPAGTVTGSATHYTKHTASGVLAGPAGVIEGTAAHYTLHSASGALVGPAGVVEGAASRWHAFSASGELSGPSGVIEGTATHYTLHTASGELVGPAGVVEGSATLTVGGEHSASGVLSGPGGVIEGTATHYTLHTASGALSGPAGVISGIAVGPEEETHAGGDDAYHHTGWNKKAWKKKQKREEAIEETIRETYQKMMGIAPSVEVVESVAQEVKKESPPAAQNPATFDYSGVAEWLQAQETIIAQIIAKRQEDEEDDEEAILLLL